MKLQAVLPSPSQNRLPRDLDRSYLVYYMPFAGVKYYSILTGKELKKGSPRIGPVGWRVEYTLPEDASVPAAA